MKKILFTALITLSVFVDVEAQQDPHYTQYMYNMNVINPAYAGSKENLSFGLLYRQQWEGIEDAPRTFTFSGHSPAGKNVGLGLSVISDEIGPVKEQNVYGDFSYTLNLGGEHRLALGIKAGATFQKIGLFSDINGSLPDPTDEAFSEDSNNTYFNIGTGFFYYTNNYYIALSVPNMLKSKHLNVRRDGQERYYGEETQHYFLTGGYVFQLTDNIKFYQLPENDRHIVQFCSLLFNISCLAELFCSLQQFLFLVKTIFFFDRFIQRSSSFRGSFTVTVYQCIFYIQVVV